MRLNLKRIKNFPTGHILAVITATKPDFYKQAPIVHAAIEHDLPVCIINTGQHYDEILGFGLNEFNLNLSIIADLEIRGNLIEKTSGLVRAIARLHKILRKTRPDITFHPLVHGDTIVAGVFPMAWMFATGMKSYHNESGLRAMTPIQPGRFHRQDLTKFLSKQFSKDSWRLTRLEPFPEQYDTFISSAASDLLLAPTELNKDHLLREGYSEYQISVSGNSIVDAVAETRKRPPEVSIFEQVSKLESDCWLRVDIHRRANLIEHRFRAIVGGIRELVRAKFNVCWVMLNATKFALKKFHLEKSLYNLAAKYPNFIITDLWKEYKQVIEFFDSGHCWASYTDSGSQTEELTLFPNVRCLIARYSTDRPESVFDANSSVIVPPISRFFISKTIKLLHRWEELWQPKNRNVYGSPGKVSSAIVETIRDRMESNPTGFQWDHNRLFGTVNDETANFL